MKTEGGWSASAMSGLPKPEPEHAESPFRSADFQPLSHEVKRSMTAVESSAQCADSKRW